MPDWECSICDNDHDSIPMDIAFAKPQHYFDIPEQERNQRVWTDSDQNADLCVIDGTAFLVRAFLPIPVDEGDQEFRFGVWVEVDEGFFKDYMQYKYDEVKGRTFDARLATEVPGYPSTNLLPAELEVQDGNGRPTVRVIGTDHPLAREQEEGVRMQRVHEIVQTCLPSLFRQH